MALCALVVALMFAAGVWLTRPEVATGTQQTDAGGLGGPVMTASTQQLDHPAYGAAPGAPGEWRATDQTAGAWLQLDQQPEVVSRVALTRPNPDAPGIREGYLAFSDGSTVHVRLSDATTVVPVMPRLASSVRFTVTATDPGADTAALAELDLGAASGDAAVATSAPSSGNLATGATVTPLAGGDQRSAELLVDGDPTTVAAPGDGLRLDWARPREVTGIAVTGAPDGALLRSATIVFSDGSSLPLGGVTHDVRRPTVLSFMPRVTTSVRLEVDQAVEGDRSDLRLGEVAVLQRGAPASRAAGPDPGAAVETPLRLDAATDCEASTADARDAIGPVVLCPTTGAEVDGVVDVQVAAGPSYDAVRAVAWSGEQVVPEQDASTPAEPATTPPVVAALDADRTGTVSVDVGGLPAGPLVVQLLATGPDGESPATYLQLVHSTGRAQAEPEHAAPAGRTLVYDEEFDRPVSLTREGDDADFTSAKPESWGVSEFGKSAFLDPSSGLHPAEVVDDDYLRMRMQPLPDGTADPMGWGRTYGGAMLGSARPGGSGFSAQYGYFEARMLAPAAPGAWPAFWLLPSTNLVDPQPVVAEIDAVELYGHDPVSTCHVTHEFPDPSNKGSATCGQRWDSPAQAMTWHTYGVEVLPDRTTFYVDGVQVTEKTTPVGADDPMFFMLDLAKGGGWPEPPASTRGRGDLYVDWVRVYV